jgi:hypothetical protein
MHLKTDSANYRDQYDEGEQIIKECKPPMQSNKVDSAANANAYNGVDRNAFIFGFNPQAELWNGRLAMIGFLAYLLWDLSGVSVVRDLLHLVSY